MRVTYFGALMMRGRVGNNDAYSILEPSVMRPLLTCQGKHTDWNRPPWPGTTVTICVSYFTTGGPTKEHGTNKPSPTRRVQERLKGGTTGLTTSQKTCWHSSWLSNVCATKMNPESEWLSKDKPETNPITIKPETWSHMAEQPSWVPLPYGSPPGCPLPRKSLALSACVSPQTIHFWIFDKRHFSGPGNGPPSCNRLILRLFSPDIHCYKINGKIQGSKGLNGIFQELA